MAYKTNKIVDLESAKAYASERGWYVEDKQIVQMYGTWEVIQWKREYTDDSVSLVECCWVTMPTSRKTSLKHGVYVSERLKTRGEIKAMGGTITAVYWPLEHALEEA